DVGGTVARAAAAGQTQLAGAHAGLQRLDDQLVGAPPADAADVERPFAVEPMVVGHVPGPGPRRLEVAGDADELYRWRDRRHPVDGEARIDRGLELREGARRRRR